MKTFKLTVTEDELKALIDFHKQSTTYDVETSERIHSLTKRLNRDTPEIENDPRQHISEQPQVSAAKEEQPTSW